MSLPSPDTKEPTFQQWYNFANELEKLTQDCAHLNEETVSAHSEKNDCDKAFSKSDLSYINKLLNSKLLESKESDIEILRSDPNHPLHSVKSFQEMNLNNLLLKGVASMGFYKPSMIQEKALTSLIGSNPQNMIAQSQSGTGKTATFLLAMLSRIQPEKHYCQCLCMAPTRELAMQIVSVGRNMARFMPEVTFGAAVRDGTTSVDAEGYVTSQVVIGTPGTISQWIRGFGSYRIDPAKIIVFVLDEADVMMDQEGFLNISFRIKSKLSPTCQVLLFSATYDDQIMDFARDLVENPIELRVKQSQLTLKNIQQFHLLVTGSEEKYSALTEIYGGFDVGQAIIFCATRKEAGWLKEQMTLAHHHVVVLSGDLDVQQREKVITSFRLAECRVLITTNVCARGLDIPQVNLIINWDLPITFQNRADCDTYLHRIGRSGRFGQKGVAVSFVTAGELQYIKQLEEYFEISIPALTEDYFSIM